MAYLGTPPRSRVLSSADIDPGSVSLDDISFTDQPASMNISGNIDKHTMRLADQVVVNGDLDITDNLILSKISDDGNAIILTTDGSTRTIEGAGGSLEASTLSQTPNASLTGMTGTVGKDTFPTGSIIQVVSSTKTDRQLETGATDKRNLTGLSVKITPRSASNKILIQVHIGSASHQHGSEHVFFDIDGTTTQSVGDAGTGHECSAVTKPHSDVNGQESCSFSILDSPNTTSEKTYQVRGWVNSNAFVVNGTYTQGTSTGNTISTITAMEIVG